MKWAVASQRWVQLREEGADRRGELQSSHIPAAPSFQVKHVVLVGQLPNYPSCPACLPCPQTTATSLSARCCVHLTCQYKLRALDPGLLHLRIALYRLLEPQHHPNAACSSRRCPLSASPRLRPSSTPAPTSILTQHPIILVSTPRWLTAPTAPRLSRPPTLPPLTRRSTLSALARAPR